MITPIEAPEKGNGRSSGYARASNDYYCEPRRAIDALLDAEPFVGKVWDPACGGGNIPDACNARGIKAVGSDIVDRAPGFGNYDFLGRIGVFRMPDNIIANPPFNLAVEFTLRALRLASRKVAILQRTTWVEGERRYQSLFLPHPPARIWQFRSRISMPPGGSGAVARGGSVAFAWYVWSRDHVGPPVFGWLP